VLKNVRFAKSCYDCFVGKEELGPGDVLLLAFPLLCGTVAGDLSEWQREVERFSVRRANEKELKEEEVDCSRRIVEWAWGYMRHLPGRERPIVPQRIQSSEDGERALDTVVHWCDEQTLPKRRADWTCTAAGFYFGGEIRPFSGVNLRLLEAFAKAEGMKLTKQQIIAAAGNEYVAREAKAYVSDLNRKLRDLLRLVDNPVKRVSTGIYQFFPPASA
jgi:hypothetical protein